LLWLHLYFEHGSASALYPVTVVAEACSESGEMVQSFCIVILYVFTTDEHVKVLRDGMESTQLGVGRIDLIQLIVSFGFLVFHERQTVKIEDKGVLIHLKILLPPANSNRSIHPPICHLLHGKNISRITSPL